MALAGAAKGIAAKKGQSNAIKDDYAQREDQRKRQQSAFELTQLPELQSAEKRNTVHDALFSGFLGNFARNADGTPKSQRMADLFNDPYHYRSYDTLKGLSPYAAPLLKPRTPGALSYIGAGLGGAASGAADYYKLGGQYGADKLGLPGLTGTPGGSSGYGGPSVLSGAMSLFGKGGGGGSRAGTSVGPTRVLAGNLQRGTFQPMQFQGDDEFSAD